MEVERRVIRVGSRLSGVSWSPDSRHAELLSVAFGVVLFGVIGTALAWQPLFIIVGAIAFASATWLAGSLTRAVACVFAATGLVAAVLAAGVMLSGTLFVRLHVSWLVVAIAWFVVVSGLCFVWRRSRPVPAFELADLFGAGVGIVVALAIWRKVDFHTNLLRLLVGAEDNQAWVGLSTEIHRSFYVGPGFVERFDGRGPIIATLIGLLGELQQTSVPTPNAAFAAWTLPVVLTPLVAVGLMRACTNRNPIVLVAFAAVLSGWAFFVPFRLFGGFGHLTATWAFLFVLALVVVVALDVQSAPSVPAVLGLAFCAGTVWYPIFPLGLAAIGVVMWRSMQAGGGRGRVASMVLAAALALVMALQMAYAIGLVGAPPGVSSGLQTLYSAQGGTQALDGTLGWLVPLALVALAFTPLTRSGKGANLWRVMSAGLVYVVAVFAGAYAVEVGIGYGPTKVWFIVGFSIAVCLVALVPRYAMPPRAVVIVLVALGFGSFVYGGSGDLISRAWPGAGSDPSWLGAVEAVSASGESGTARPIACLSTDKYQAYLCTRWGAGLSTGLDQPFLSYRLQVMGDQDPSSSVDALVSSGDIAASDLIVLDTPPTDRSWAWKMIANAGRVFGPDGKPLEPRPTPPAAS